MVREDARLPRYKVVRRQRGHHRYIFQSKRKVRLIYTENITAIKVTGLYLGTDEGKGSFACVLRWCKAQKKA